MLDLAFYDVMGFPPGRGGAPAQVGFLEIKKERFVEIADLIQHRLPDHHRRAGRPVHPPRKLRLGQRDHMPGQKAGDRTGADRRLELARHRGEAERGLVRGAVGAAQP